jgi:hypothetical protein
LCSYCLLQHIFLKKDRGKDRHDWKRIKKMYEAAGLHYGKERLLEIEIRITRSYSVGYLLWEKLWTCHKTLQNE